MTSSPMGNHDADGVSPLAVSLHWLTASSKVMTAADCVEIAKDYLNCSVDVHERGQFGYTRTYELFGGLKLLENDSRPEMGVCLYAPGETCEVLGLERLSWLYQCMHMTATRVDVAVDNCPFAPSKLRWHWERDNVRTNCKPADPKRHYIQPGREHVRTCDWHSNQKGDTFYMGSRSSTQMARCYNSRGFTRFEMELKKDRAAQVMRLLCDGTSMDQVALGVISEFVAFVRLDDERRDRCSLQPFWEKFIRGFERVQTYVEPRPQTTIARKLNWIEGQVSKGLALYEDIKLQEAQMTGQYGNHLPSIRQMIRLELRDLGKSKYDDSDRVLLDMHQAVLDQRSQERQSYQQLEGYIGWCT